MKGKVVSFVAAKKFGFIDGDDGESYFLHVSKLKDKSQQGLLIKGAIVSFDPTPTPRGLSAAQITVLPVHLGVRLVPFFVTKNEPKHGSVILRKKIETSFLDSPEEAFDHLKSCAMQATCNAVLNIKLDRHVFSDGNYKFSRFAYLGELALITEEYVCSSEKEANSSILETEQLRKEAEHKADEIIEIEGQARHEQLNPKQLPWGIIATALILFLFVALMFSSE